MRDASRDQNPSRDDEMLYADEETWQVRIRHRTDVVNSVKSTLAYYYSLRFTNRPKSPDPEDRTVSKRQSMISIKLG